MWEKEAGALASLHKFHLQQNRNWWPEHVRNTRKSQEKRANLANNTKTPRFIHLHLTFQVHMQNINTILFKKNTSAHSSHTAHMAL